MFIYRLHENNFFKYKKKYGLMQNMPSNLKSGVQTHALSPRLNFINVSVKKKLNVLWKVKSGRCHISLDLPPYLIFLLLHVFLGRGSYRLFLY